MEETKRSIPQGLKPAARRPFADLYCSFLKKHLPTTRFVPAKAKNTGPIVIVHLYSQGKVRRL